MTTRRQFISAIPAAGATVTLGEGLLAGPAHAQQALPALTGWHSPSLTPDLATAPNGAITTQTAIEANARWGITAPSAAEVAPGVFLLSGWGIAHSMAIRAEGGWIIVDTGDSTRTAAEMRAKLETAAGGPVRVAAILLTHWHYADGIDAWLDEGTEVWGHEWLDANRTAASGVSVKSGFYQARAIAQFGVLHPAEGPDAFPNSLGFTPEKLLAVSSYRPPTRLFEHGKVAAFSVAGETAEVGPNRTDSSDSVGFWFPSRKLLISNFMVPGGIFNVYSLRGGAFRNPLLFLQDSRWMESRDAEILLDVHGPAVTGADNVRSAIQRAADQVQLIHDQTLRMAARGMDGREAAEAVYMPRHQREGWENYGQVESHVRQVYNGTVGWFGHDVYDINPLGLQDEAVRIVGLAGGVDAVRSAATAASAGTGIADWQWALKLTSLLLRLDPQDAAARLARAAAARAIGQRTTTANGRGWFLTEALAMEGALAVAGKPVTLDLVRAVLGTPAPQALIDAPVSANLEFLRYLVDPRLAEDARLSFTLAVAGEAGLQRITLRNGVLVIGSAGSAGDIHLEVSREDLAGLVLGDLPFAALAPGLAALDVVLDRSHLVRRPVALGGGLDSERDRARLSAEGEH